MNNLKINSGTDGFVSWAKSWASFGVDYVLETGRLLSCLSKSDVYLAYHPDQQYRAINDRVSRLVFQYLAGEQQEQKVTFLQGFDLRQRHFYIFPKLNRVWILSDAKMIMSVLHAQRGGEMFDAGYLDLLGPIMGENNMLLCPFSEHRRLRGVVERYFTPKAVSSPARFEQIMLAAIHSLASPHSVADDRVLNFVGHAFGQVLGLLKEDLPELLDILPSANQLDPTSKPELENLFHRIFIGDRFEPDQVLDGLSKSSTLTVEEKISTAILLVTAGTHTTTNLIKFFLNSLESDPKYRDEIRQEWSDFIAGHEVKDQEVFFELFNQFTTHSKWLNACYQETLRLFPIIALLSRVAKQSIQLDALSIQKGDMIFLNFLASQRHTGVWGDDAWLYRPERWVEGQKAPLLDFSFGSQKCLGMHLAKREALIFAGLFSILLDVRPRPDRLIPNERRRAGMAFNGFSLDCHFIFNLPDYNIAHDMKAVISAILN